MPKMFALDKVVPWGRSYEEYLGMFALDEADMNSRILGCADGPAGFNAEATRLGKCVVSVDPLYRFSTTEIRERISVTSQQILGGVRHNAADFLWHRIPTVDDLGRVRMRAMQTFLDDYDAGRRDGRYIDAELPALPFSDNAFDLAVCSHFLFLYSEQMSEAFHIGAIREMCRVAQEVRIFPLLAMGGRPSPYVAPVFRHLSDIWRVSVEPVAYEFQRGGNQMLRIRSLRKD